MERLTFEGNFCDIAQCRELPCPYDNNCTQKQVWERLKSYEDTGISPKACAQAREIEDGLNADDYSIARIVEIMNADKEGRVAILPCKDGDTVWRLQYVHAGKGTIPAETVKTRFNLFMLYQFGKTVFLTREEAENALEAMNGDQ